MDGGADELLGAQRSNTRKREKTELKAAEIFLQEALGNGPMPSNKLIEKAEGAGISRATLWQAKESLHLKASKARGTVDGEWFWRLAEDSHEGSSRARVRGNE